MFAQALPPIDIVFSKAIKQQRQNAIILLDHFNNILKNQGVYLSAICIDSFSHPAQSDSPADHLVPPRPDTACSVSRTIHRPIATLITLPQPTATPIHNHLTPSPVSWRHQQTPLPNLTTVSAAQEDKLHFALLHPINSHSRSLVVEPCGYQTAFAMARTLVICAFLCHIKQGLTV